ncbi:hypothetical protein M409DRAFT_49310 [Zasmidium cellare ATCC 36951]|uniref:Uncharacterized protein n=1 Tax=Zasmidium cellare ATCC 36951 TaxID=1080233 RepID=A0A6A6D2W9_ZASCE|nr:uncharacterized protein M409DRAFT_49310 [Zasmidium cellare ATCC 36951]KAF2172778.1 hypothetical protein M409DRAFT_49310 [Zasmidium cellare ATCC 36951]
MPEIFCSTCDRSAPRPVLVCLECPETLTYYCDERCRDKDLQSHKLVCHNPIRTAIYRAGDLLLAIFYTFREAAFEDLEKDGDVLHVSLAESSHQALLHRFPNHLVRLRSDKEKLLALASCTASIACTYELSKHLLKDTTTTIEESLFRDLSSPTSTIRHQPDSTADETDYMHSTLSVEARDGEAYAVLPPSTCTPVAKAGICASCARMGIMHFAVKGSLRAGIG